MAGARFALPDRICSTNTIPMRTMRDVLDAGMTHRLRMPLLQRRYCWQQKQLTKLLSDICDKCGALNGSDRSQMHSLGLIVVSTRAMPSSVLIVDGQQRLTTCTLLLTALRDVVQQHLAAVGGGDTAAVVEDARAFVADMNRILFPHGFTPGQVVCDCEAAVLVPTFLDRPPFLRVVCRGGEVDAMEVEEDRDDKVTVATDFFTRAVGMDATWSVAARLGGPSGRGLEAATFGCRALLRTVLDCFTVLWFEVQEADIWSVYERLAFREVVLLGHNRAPGLSLCESDLVRNFLISWFTTEEMQLEAHRQLWLPMERSVRVVKSYQQEAPELEEGAVGVNRLDLLFDAFSKSLSGGERAAVAESVVRPEDSVGGAVHLGMLGSTVFNTYKAVRAVVEHRLTVAGLGLVFEQPTLEAAEVVRNVMQDLLTFSQSDWKVLPSNEDAGSSAGAGDNPTCGAAAPKLSPRRENKATALPPLWGEGGSD